MSTFFSVLKSFLSIMIMLFKYVFYRVLSSFLTGLVLLFVAVVMFVTFYQAYMPVVSHVKPVYLQFSSDCQGGSAVKSLCSYPEASVFFTSTNKANEERMLMRGQSYKVFLDIEMPSSPTNEKLGMFMVNIKFLSAQGRVLKSSSRSCMLHYESSLVRLFRTILYSLPLTLGLTEEKQKVEVKFFDDYIDDSYNPAVQAKVVIMTKQIEIYSSTLRLQASFTGLRYVIFNWPLLFGCLAIFGNFVTVALIYSACVNQFSSSPTTSSTSQQDATPRQEQNRILPNMAPGARRAVPATSRVTSATTTAEASSSGETTTSSLPGKRSSAQVPGLTICTACKGRNRKVNGMPSARVKACRKRQTAQQSGSGKPRCVNFKDKQQPVPQAFVNEGERSENTSFHCLEEGNLNLNGQQVGDKIKSMKDDQSFGTILRQRRIKHIKHRKHSKDEGNCSQDKLQSHAKENGTKQGSNMDKKGERNLSSEAQLQATKLSMWNRICFLRKWEIFKLPRIRRLGLYLQDNMPLFTKRVRHCISDLELSTAEENRIVHNDNNKRSSSASDLTMAGSTAFVGADNHACQSREY